MNSYCEAIDVLMSSDGESQRDLLIQIAKMNPSVLVKAYKALRVYQNNNTVGWEVKVIPLLNEGRKVMAIKTCKKITGWDLKVCKHAVEQLMERLRMDS